MKTPHKAKTIRLTEQDKEAVAEIRRYYGLSSDNEAIRFALNKGLRDLQQEPAFEKEPLKQERSRKRGQS